ncbi:MAG: signal recognition particle-docking protein FtsY [Deltaproteobacteria bacterium]|jgi:fused signal recognition particle receptor
MSWFKKKKTDQNRKTQQEDFEKKAEESEDLIGAEFQADDAAAQDTAVEVDADSAAPKTKGFFSRLKNGLAKTRKILTTDIDELFAGRQKLDDELLEELEEMLITSDIGVATATDLIEELSKKSHKITDAESLKGFFKEEILNIIGSIVPAEKKPMHKPHVVMVVGVNGVGKTTTIGKLAAKQTSKGKKVLIAAADTFRAAAVEQLSIWAERAKADIVKHQDNADPAAVVYDSIEAAVSRDVDVVYIDTAGRLHTKINLMEEIKKIKRTAGKKLFDAPHEILLVLDATTGQNALSQAQLFNDALDITGLALTKLDGTAKGGIVISICRTLNIPLQYIGVGEGIDDLQDFDAEAFVEALF